MVAYLRKGETPEGYVPFTNEEFLRAKKLLDEDSRFQKPGEGWYISDFGDIQFSDAVNKQVHIGSEMLGSRDPIIGRLVEILQPTFFLDAKSERHEISELFS